MKKLLSVIVALSMCASVMTFSAGTASAATVDTYTVSEASMESDLQTKLKEMSATETIAVRVEVSTEAIYENIDVVAFAKENGFENDIEFDEDGNIESYTAEFMRAFLDYFFGESLQECDRQYNLIKENYCESVLNYERPNGVVVCVATKAQIENMSSNGCATRMVLADKAYAYTDNKITWQSLYDMEDEAREYFAEAKDVVCTKDKYDVVFGDFVNDTCLMFTVSEKEINFGSGELKRMDDIVWTQRALDAEPFLYENGTIYTLGEALSKDRITFEDFKDIGGRYFCDTNYDDIVDVNDVTQLQLDLANQTESDPLFEILQGVTGQYNDVNFDGYVDVKDVTTIQMYLAGYEV